MFELVKVDDGEPVFLWALDMAAKAAGYCDWEEYLRLHFSVGCKSSIIAHARTLAKYETPPVDPAELKRRQDAREFAARGYVSLAEENATAFTAVSWFSECAEKCRAGKKDDDKAVYAIYEYACHRDGTTPIPVEGWGK